MLRILLTISFIALLACNSGETNPGDASNAGDTSPVSAAGSDGDVEIERVEIEEIEMDAVAAEVSSCLDLVKARAYTEALPICIEAAAIDPANTKVQAALAKAEVEAELQDSITAAEAQAQAEIDGEIDSAGDSAKGAAADALGAGRD